ncbi:tyrosine-type recombinase/integrase [Acidiphilium sp.]|uniref:tyrosine-type recombinase/integrase n=1 Tax=Acidiphilium sp. TaxID=527 RepID=UPI003D04AD00
MAVARITAAALDKLPPGQTLWDVIVRGFGARRQKDDVVFVFKGVAPITRKQIFLTIGRRARGDWNIEDARSKATEWRLMIRNGQDPSEAIRAIKTAMTVSELCDLYMSEVATSLMVRKGRPKKPSTIYTDKGRIEWHIKPLLGDMKVNAVTLGDVETFQHRVAQGDTKQPRGAGRGGVATGGRGVAARTVGLLGALFTFAMKRGLCPSNPVKGVARFADKQKSRRLSDDEYRMLADGLAQVGTSHPIGTACIKFLALTGWRRGEAVNLQWIDIDGATRTAMLPDTKTDKSMRALSHAALAVLGTVPRRAGSPWVFPAASGNGPIASIPRVWDRVAKLGGLPTEITPHTMRHGFASVAADLNMSESTIAALIGHKTRSVTGKYSHHADTALLVAADKVADSITARMGEAKPVSEVVQLRR